MNKRRPATLHTQESVFELFAARLRRIRRVYYGEKSKAIMYCRRPVCVNVGEGCTKLIFDDSLSSAYVPESSLSPIEESGWGPFVECS